MRKHRVFTLAAGLLVAATLACGGTATPDATPIAQLTALLATAEAETTLAAATLTATTLATDTPAPTPTPAAEYVETSEEELAEQADEAVDEAATATEEAAAAAEEAAADGTITQEELETIEAYVTDAEEAIAYADELIYAYYALYGELATETIVLLQEIEDDLDALAEEAAELDALLQEIDAALEQGVELADETIAELEAVAQIASTIAAEVRTQGQDWLQKLEAEREERVAAALAVLPSDVAADRKAAILSAFEYVDAVRESLADDKISQAELANIAQLGANASAGLKAHGGPKLQQQAASIGGITQQLAGGQVPQAKANLGALESALGTRPPKR